MKLFQTLLISSFLAACGGGGDSADTAPIVTPEPVAAPTTALVSFSVSDAPADSATEVHVTFSSITLKSASDDADDESGIVLPILDDAGAETTMEIDLMAFQNGDEQLIINNVEVDIGDYDNLILNTSGCAQNPNGSDDFCWVIDSDGRKPLKTPSNKLKLGAFSVSAESVQAYDIEFNLRSSMTSTGGGSSYNLKPHGIRLVNTDTAGTLSGTVDVNLLTAGTEEDGCQAEFLNDTDHGRIVYLYQGAIAEGSVMGDEFDPETAVNPIPENVVMPYASDTVTFDADAELYRYSFTHLDVGDYVIAFSCSALADDPVEYNEMTIANPTSQFHSVTIEENADLEQNFVEIVN